MGLIFMDLIDSLKQIGDRVKKLKDNITTEEATKNAFIMPFIQSLGYDVFNPLEVVPEFVADVGIKKGEKIDYAILKDDKPIILIECKHWAQNLDNHDGQLFRYFGTSQAKFGILTNGIIYRFFSDLVEPNKMDLKPFLEINITELKDNQVEELKKFHKSYYDAESIVSTANELKFTNELKALIHTELNNPSPDFVRHFAKQVYPSVVTQKVLDQFTTFTKKSIQQYISDLITERLKTALQKEDDSVKEQNIIVEPIQEQNKVETTQEEMDAFLVVKSILRQYVSADRIFIRDTQSYCNVLLDDNNRKTICRLYFNSEKKKVISFFDESRNETKIQIETIDSIYNQADKLVEVVKRLLGESTQSSETESAKVE